MENDKKPVDKKQDKTFVKNTIELSPKLNEEQGGTAVIGWGRMNPITSGHEIVAKTIEKVSKKERGTPMIFLTHSQDPKKNPLTYDDKIALAQKAFGPIIKRSKSKTIIQVMQELQKKFSKIVLVAGDDRVKEFETLLNKYNGKEYNFEEIRIVSAGSRADPDSDSAKDLSAKNMSASVLRKLAMQGHFDDYVDDKGKKQKGFKKGLPKKLRNDAQDIYDMVRAGMKLAEELEHEGLLVLDEAVMSYSQRIKRGQIMRRFKGKIAAARKRMANRKADAGTLKQRARKSAINKIRQKVAGAKGAAYATLGAGEKMAIDKKVEKRKSLIDKMAKKLLPSVRKAEIARLASRNKPKTEQFESINEDFDFEMFLEAQDPDIKDREGTQPARYHAGLKPSTKEKRDAQFKKQTKMDDDDPDAYKPAPGDATAKTKPSVYTKRYHQMFGKEGTTKHDMRFKRYRVNLTSQNTHFEEFSNDEQLLSFIEQTVDDIQESLKLDEAKSMDGLQKKADKSGISYGTLKKVYNRGVAAWKTGHRPGTTPQQWGYARVNAFITKKKAGNLNHDQDLANSYVPTLDEQFQMQLDEGINDPSIFKVVFLAGGPGSGKSFIVGKTSLEALGFKLVNSDVAFEKGLKDASLSMKDTFSKEAQAIRDHSKKMTKTRMGQYINGRLGLIIDGTGKDYDKIKEQVTKLKMIGYEPAMIFVNTDEETALKRNMMRSRSLPDAVVSRMWKDVQKNVGSFQSLFGGKMFIVDNSEGQDFETQATNVYKKLSAWAKKSPNNRAANAWVAGQKLIRGIKEDFEPHMMYDPETGKGYKANKKADHERMAKLGYTHDKPKAESGGAGGEGTTELAKRYKKDTPGEIVSESIDDLFEQMHEDVSQKQLNDLEKFADRLLDKFGVDVEFTKHFADRMNDDRNNPKISIPELQRFFKKVAKNKAKDIKKLGDSEAVLKDMQSDLNLPVVINYDRDKEEFEVVNKTIMRKPDFKTADKVIKY